MRPSLLIAPLSHAPSACRARRRQQDIHFVSLRGDAREPQQYVRDTTGEFADLLTTSYAAPVPLPDAAVDTGYRHEGRELWLVPGKAAYLVSLRDPADVERWPAVREPILCA